MPDLNLSCKRCKAIRPFSGQPPMCNACGWVLGSPLEWIPEKWTPPKAKIKRLDSEALWTFVKFLFWGALICGGLIAVTTWLTPEADRLAARYQTSKDKVIITPKPHGCDFDDAPLGNKHCHFEKTIDVERACPGQDCKVTFVYVSWRKNEE